MWIRCFWPLYVYSNDRVPARGCRMKVCNRGPQMLVTTAGAFTAFSLMTIAVGTDYWLYSRGVCRTKSVNDNDTNRKNEEVLTHSGLWRQCCMEGTFIGVCKNIDHFLEDADYEQDAAEYLLRLSNIIGIIVYISSNAGDPNQSESKRSHWYGWSFYCGALSFIIAETVGVLTVHLFIDTHRVLRAQSNRSLRPSTHSSLQHRRSTSYRSRYRWKQGQNRSSDTRSREPSPTRYGNDLGLYTLGRGLPPKATHTLAHNSVNSAGGFAHFHNSVIANNSFANPRVCSVKSERGLPHVQNSLCSEKGIAFANAHRENSVKPENGVVLSQNFKQNSVNPSKFPVHAQNSVSDIAHTQSVLSSTATRRTTPV
ncbi:voltage-dependent calcium channel gamma-3 subunit isoform X2 [Xyrauchen texanus]|uniref:voltage-dependent calcium channel gamma-3 subunit isoform X2 n=1 Tax=Xyrauchen texanus TaxID=154827 RepID=UPI0022423F7B|nr:voltage-dependent calcium channel gamma-3 subunit isoform X2 [Xyrauchen texanus]